MIVSFKTRLYIGFTLAILVSATSGIISYQTFQKQATQRQWLRRTRHVTDTVKAIQNMVVEMETGRRGFRATGQTRFLEPYNDVLPHIAPAVAGLKDSLTDNPEDEKTAEILAQHISTLMQFWKNNGDDASKYGGENIINIATNDLSRSDRESITKITDTEKKQVDSIRSIIATLEKNENKLLLARREEYEAMMHNTTLSTSVGSILSELIIVILTIFVFREFKRRRLIQEQLKGTVKKLELQATELQKSEEEQTRARKEIEVINKQLEKFVYTVAHDIKSPLAGISGSLSILSADKTIADNPELAEFVALSSDRVVHLSEMVNSILEYSRVSLDKQQVEEVDTKKLVEEITTLMFPPQNIHVVIAGQMPVFKTKRIKIMEVFQNLMSNAIKYNNKKEGYIEIGCNEQKDNYLFYVKDNGLGIPDENKPHIFSLFRDAHNKNMRESSTGFGLNIVKLIVEEQGGKIWVDSVPGAGSTFYFEWKK